MTIRFSENRCYNICVNRMFCCIIKCWSSFSSLFRRSSFRLHKILCTLLNCSKLFSKLFIKLFSWRECRPKFSEDSKIKLLKFMVLLFPLDLLYYKIIQTDSNLLNCLRNIWRLFPFGTQFQWNYQKIMSWIFFEEQKVTGLWWSELSYIFRWLISGNTLCKGTIVLFKISCSAFFTFQKKVSPNRPSNSV